MIYYVSLLGSSFLIQICIIKISKVATHYAHFFFNLILNVIMVFFTCCSIYGKRFNYLICLSIQRFFLKKEKKK
ncbi:hypothetical protein BY996DRAFT_7035856 [Phakopsora pachyrhizi]|nr:hypothetical protein BY996DRAFT_7035856 [Phakopsora pachyrhizi]